MNVFRILGDGFHLVSFVILLAKIWINGSSAGVSGKTQILLSIVFSTRYVDLFAYYVSQYNSAMKIIFICLSYATVISIYLKFRKSYEQDDDSLRFEFLIAAALVLALVVNYQLEFFEVFWTFSIYLEAVAAWPQFFMISKTRKVLTSVFFYLLAAGLYRIFYIANWIQRYYSEGHIDLISSASGIVQVIPYLIFWGCCATGVVVITRKERWFKRNLQQNLNENSVFTIKVQEESGKGNDKLPLLSNLEEMAGSESKNIQIV